MELKYILFVTFSLKVGGHYSHRQDWLGFIIKCYSLNVVPQSP